MYLVHGQRCLVHGYVPAARHPLLVLPLMVRGRHDRGIGGRNLGVAGHRVGAHRVRTVRAADVELVERTLADRGEEQLPDPAGTERTHREARAVPVVEVPHDPHTAGIGRPDGEPRTGDPLVLHGLCAEGGPQLLVPPLADQMQIEIAERGQEAVRIMDLDLVVRVADQELVLGDGRHRQQSGEETVAVVVQLGPQPLGEYGHRSRVRTEHPDRHTAADHVRAEQIVRGMVLTGEQPPPVGVVEGPHRPDAATATTPRPRGEASARFSAVFFRLAGVVAEPAGVEGAAVALEAESAAVAGLAAGVGLAAGADGVAVGSGALRDDLRAVTGTASSRGVGEAGIRWPGQGRSRPAEEARTAQDQSTAAARRWIAAIGTGSQSGRCRASYSTSYTALSVSWARNNSGSLRGSTPAASAYPSQYADRQRAAHSAFQGRCERAA